MQIIGRVAETNKTMITNHSFANKYVGTTWPNLDFVLLHSERFKHTVPYNYYHFRKQA